MRLLHRPWERIAVLDTISGGRVEFGGGRAISACTQPSSIEFAAGNGIGVLGFGIGQGESNDNRFALFVSTLCCDTDEEALALQGPNFKQYNEQVRQLFAPWIDGKAPHSYSWFMEYYKERYEQGKGVSMEDIVAAGGACFGSVETCTRVLQHLADAGVDEVMLFMQQYTTPHDKIMRSIELIAKEVLPRVKLGAVSA